MDLPSYFVSLKGSIVSTWSSFCSVCHSICSFVIFLVYLEGIIFFQGPIVICGRDNAVDIVTRYGGGWSGDRMYVGSRLSAFVQTGPGSYPVSYTVGTGPFPGLNDRHPHLAPRLKKE
jgi:hypothetical protein